MTVTGHDQLDLAFSRVLDLAHSHLGLDVAWLSEFRGGEQRLRAVAGDGASFGGLEVGSTLEHAGTYCSRVVAGALPNALPDVAHDVRTRDMPVTAELGVGAYVGVPVTLPDGKVYGMLCSLSHDAVAVSEREVRFLGLLADVLAGSLVEDEGLRADRALRRERVERVIGGEGLRMAFQPIVALAAMRISGAEALARFEAEPRNPALWFADAAMLGLGVELELAAIRLALEQLDGLPPDAYLSLNVSPATVVSPGLLELLGAAPGERLLLEVTEQSAIDDYESVVDALFELRRGGARIAVDDAGAGYASLNHILRLRPDVIKLDVALTRDVDSDPARQALVRALVEFGRDIDAQLVAEGVETKAELDMLVWLGVTSAQGYYLARPGDLPLPRALPPATTRRFAVAVREGLGGRIARMQREVTDDEAFVRELLAEATAITGLESSYLTFYADGMLEHRWVHNAGDLRVPEPFTIPWEESLCHRSREAGVRWTAAVPEDLPGCGLAEEAGIRTFVSLPIGSVSDETARSGTLCALGREPRYLDRDAMERLELIAAAIGARLSHG